jgi:hypothetical protein
MGLQRHFWMFNTLIQHSGIWQINRHYRNLHKPAGMKLQL